MDPFTRRLMAASGYLELGLAEEAGAELDAIEPAERRKETPVVALRVAICQALARWDQAVELCRHLASVEPEEPGWLVSLAYATRRAESIAAAREILLRAHVRFPQEAIIAFNLACYAAQTGELTLAHGYLAHACVIDPDLRDKARLDPDLDPLWPKSG